MVRLLPAVLELDGKEVAGLVGDMDRAGKIGRSMGQR
jgi:hypothetical protein